MRYFDEQLEKGTPKELIMIASLKEAKILIAALEYQVSTLPKKKTIKIRALLKEMNNNCGCY